MLNIFFVKENYSYRKIKVFVRYLLFDKPLVFMRGGKKNNDNNFLTKKFFNENGKCN